VVIGALLTSAVWPQSSGRYEDQSSRRFGDDQFGSRSGRYGEDQSGSRSGRRY
jgi:hypothetical protein